LTGFVATFDAIIAMWIVKDGVVLIPDGASRAGAKRSMTASTLKERVEAIDNPEGHVRLIESQWQQFAAFAYDKYLAAGRGAVVVDLRSANESGQVLTVPSCYVAEGSPGLAQRGGWPDEDVAEVVRTYDPDLDVVFIVLRLDGDAFHYILADELTPCIAHRNRSSPTP
jgi:hypothetical protein